MSFDADVPTLTAEEQEQILEKEANLARERDEEQRNFMERSEEMRMAREMAMNKKVKQEEAARLAEIQRLESEAADVAGSLRAPEDEDQRVSGMFAALTQGGARGQAGDMRRPE